MSKTRAYLFVLPWSVTATGGVNEVVLNLYRHFETGGVYTPKILVTSWHRVRSSDPRGQGRYVDYMRFRPPIVSSAPVVSMAKWLICLLPDLFHLARYLRSNGVAVVNVHYPSLCALQFVLARLFFHQKLRVILSFHGLDLVHSLQTRGVERWLWRLLLRKADAVVGCSDAQKESISVLEPSIKPLVKTIHNGVDIDYLTSMCNPCARVDARLEGRPFILSVAAYQRKKGLDTLLHAFKLLHDDGCHETMLAMVGGDGGLGNELRNTAAELGLSDHVVFCGEIPHSNLHAYFEAASVFCLPSRYEPFGIVLLEAGAFRCPVVATSVGGITEILNDNVNAYLVPPDQPMALAAQLRGLLNDIGDRRRLAAALFEHVRMHFTWKRAYDSYLKLCEYD